MFLEVILIFADLISKWLRQKTKNALFIPMQLQLDLLQPSSSKDLTSEGYFWLINYKLDT